MERRSNNAIMIGVVIAIAVGVVAGAVFLLNANDDGNNEKTYTLTYFDGGQKVIESSVLEGSLVTIVDIERSYDGRFLGWNTNPDGSGNMLKPGSKTPMNGNLTLYAMFGEEGRYAIILPSEQTGYSIESNHMFVDAGGSAILSYVLAPSHTDYDLVISVNGNPIKLDALKRIYLSDINEDQVVTVTGVYDKRVNTITLPEDQVGYVLTSSAEQVHYGESYYLEYVLLDGYEETDSFAISVVDGEPLTISDGVITVEDVRANHVVTVAGVKAIDYRLTAGKNVILNVDGVQSSTATVEDVVTITIPNGYSLPESFNRNIKGPIEMVDNGYKVSGDVTFPSVLKVTAGENVMVNDLNEVFVCQSDRVKVTPIENYEMPTNYSQRLSNIIGVTEHINGFSFKDDTTVPSVYEVTFNSHNSVFSTLFVASEDFVPKPVETPHRVGYSFDNWSWDFNFKVLQNLTIESIWTPLTHTVNFGSNLIVIHNGKTNIFYETGGQLLIRTDEEIEVETLFEIDLPDDYCPDSNASYYIDGKYTIIGDCTFPGVVCIVYFDSHSDETVEHCATIGRGYSIMNAPTWEKEGYTFSHWIRNGEIIYGQIEVKNEKYLFTPVWERI